MARRLFDPKPDPRAHTKSQPALFDQKQVKPTNEHRYPRGFTPQRMRNVRDAMKRRDYGAFGDVVVGPEKIEGPGALQAHFRETVARSTVPLTGLRDQVKRIEVSGGRRPGQPDLAGLTHTKVDRYGLLNLKAAAPGTSEVSIYHGVRLPQILSEARKPVSRSEIMGSTIIHELGHVQETRDKPVDAYYNKSGQKEAFADRFANRHYRPDPREVASGTHAMGRDVTYPATWPEGSVAHYPGWNRLQSEARLRQSERANFNDRRMESAKEGPPAQGSLF